MNVEIGTEAAQFLEKEYINGIFIAVCYMLQDSKQYCASLAHKTDVPPGLLFEPLKFLNFDINADPDPQTLTLCYMLLQDSKQYCASLAHKTDVPPGLLFEPLKLLNFDINADPDPDPDPQTLRLSII
jgi:hypothetical protein